MICIGKKFHVNNEATIISSINLQIITGFVTEKNIQLYCTHCSQKKKWNSSLLAAKSVRSIARTRSLCKSFDSAFAL